MHKSIHQKRKLISLWIGCLILIGLFDAPTIAQTNATLAQGTWLKIGILQNNVFKIDADWLKKNGLNPTNINPKQVGIYSGPSGMLATDLKSPRTKDLRKIPNYFEGEQDGQWNSSDYLIFWGESPHTILWNPEENQWKQETHAYSDSSFYFIRLDDPSPGRIQQEEVNMGDAITLDYGWSLIHFEPETNSLIQSGRQWLADAFYGSSTKTIQYSLPDYKTGKNTKLKGRFYSSSVNPGTFSFDVPGNQLNSIEINAISGGRYDQKAFFKEIDYWVKPQLKDNAWNWSMQYKNTSGTGYLDFISILYPRTFNAKNENPLYLFPNTKDSSLSISVNNLTNSNQIWFRNGLNDWRKITGSSSSFKLEAKNKSQLVLVDPSMAIDPFFLGKIENQNIDQIPISELIIITSPPLKKAAKTLANFKNSIQKISATYVSTDQIFNAYSGGKQDVSAIRNFLFDQYNRPNSKLKYVLLLGDASVDYKGKSNVATALEKNCYVPTYQSLESTQPLLSYSSDDYYGLLDSLAGDWTEGANPQKKNLALAIGRIPARNQIDADVFVNKLMAYADQQKIAPEKPFSMAWIADDGDNNIHVQDAEDFSKIIEESANHMEVRKLYVDQFPQEMSNGNYTSAEAKKQVLNLINTQAEFIHFIGHGSESGWTDEKILTNNDILGLKNNRHLPILLTATCQFGRFDDPNIVSGAELSLLSNQGGAIGLISTTRPVFQSSNYIFGQAFYKTLIQNQFNVQCRLGDLFRVTKNLSQTGVINRNISLLGDPSMPLPWVGNYIQISTDSIEVGSDKWINGQNLEPAKTPTSAQDLFNIFVYDKPKKNKTLGTKTSPYQYMIQGNVLWKAKTSFNNNKIKISQKSIPKIEGAVNIKGFGLTNTFASIISNKNAWSVVSTKNIPDTQSPEISILLPDENDLENCSANPNLSIDFKDNNGFSWVGPMGEKAEMTVNDTLRIPLVHYFRPSVDHPENGNVRLRLENLSVGAYRIKVNCWDINQNASSKSINFRVGEKENSRAFFNIYPNPMEKELNLTIKLIPTWDPQPVQLTVFNLMGYRILDKMISLLPSIEQDYTLHITWSETELNTLVGTNLFKFEILSDQGKAIGPIISKIVTLK